jgi:hypothetical protein
MSIAALSVRAVRVTTNIPHSLTIAPHEALKRDFTEIIPALNRAGFSNIKLAYLCGRDNVDGKQTAESTIRKWAKGESEPVYGKAIVLVALFDLYCRDNRMPSFTEQDHRGTPQIDAFRLACERMRATTGATPMVVRMGRTYYSSFFQECKRAGYVPNDASTLDQFEGVKIEVDGI